MKEFPYLFSAPMVLALLAGTKTQTRRIIEDPAKVKEKPGDLIWVRETLRKCDKTSPVHDCHVWRYAADGIALSSRSLEAITWAHKKRGNTCVSIHMPRWASRITLRITEIGTLQCEREERRAQVETMQGKLDFCGSHRRRTAQPAQ